MCYNIQKRPIPYPFPSLTSVKHHDRWWHFRYVQTDGHIPNKENHHYVSKHIGHVQDTSVFSNTVY